ncbi:MAG: prenyltransferase [Gammaproteobacteria bacterium]|jgi:1,4-dihydroxy-2-naphthoate octaprenyltransferase|nr:prenyltransferase [Gammaproteobacteria bacterium]
MRVPFLVLTPVCVFLGVAAALHARVPIDVWNLVLALTGAVAAHVSVNLLNEYADCRSGLDGRTQRTAFSGGSGALTADPAAAPTVLGAGIAALVITVAAGLWLIDRSGPEIVPIGVAGIVIIATYSTWISRHPFVCLVAPGLGVGSLMVVGTYRVLTGEVTLLPVLVSLVPLFLVSNLLLLNQFPDREADSSVGRRHFPIAYGLRASAVVYGIFVAAAATVIVGGLVRAQLPPLCSTALIPLGAGVAACFGAVKYAEDRENLLPYLVMNAIAAVLVPLVLAVSLAVA